MSYEGTPNLCSFQEENCCGTEGTQLIRVDVEYLFELRSSSRRRSVMNTQGQDQGQGQDPHQKLSRRKIQADEGGMEIINEGDEIRDLMRSVLRRMRDVEGKQS